MIHYWLAGDGHGYVISRTPSTIQNDSIPLKIDGAEGDGVLYADGFAIFVVEGICAIPLSCLSEREIPLLYIEGESRHTLGTISLKDGQALPSIPSAEQILALFCRYKKRADTFFEEATAKMKVLEENYNGYSLFT